ncbi:hypothetical protein [Actinoallomurus acaciae]|uniref:Major facilitator superfamily (MFS) profile domain-containing protein n=1 Tax=Actinoallomurus acaciae TaxID=502577 RepID=A0ABV5Y7Q6_9ACTN
MSVSVAQAAKVGGRSDARRWLSLTVILVAAFMDLLDVTVVNVAVPSIQRDVGAGTPPSAGSPPGTHSPSPPF